MNIILFEQMPLSNRIPTDDFRGQHIRKVLHLATGDTFTMGVVNGVWGIATITAMGTDGIRYRFEEKGKSEPLYPVTLLVAQVRPICMKRILREAVSLGVRSIMVVGADTAERSYAEAKLWSTGEYRKYLLDGAMQSGKTAIPQFSMVDSVDLACRNPDQWQTRLLLDNVTEGEPLSQLQSPATPVVLAVGPERGWSGRERLAFDNAGFSHHSLGTRVLRTETACSAGLAVLMGRMGIL